MIRAPRAALRFALGYYLSPLRGPKEAQVVRGYVRGRETRARHGVRRDYERAGGRLLLPVERNWAGAAVAVQAELDAGFAVFTSPVLVLGRLGRGKM